LIAVTTVGAVAAAVAGSLVIAMMSIPVIDIGTLLIGQEEREGDDSSGVVMIDNDNSDAEVEKYAHNFLEVTLSRLWEGLFGRRTTTAKMMEMSRDNVHEEDVVLRATVNVRDSLRGGVSGVALRPSAPLLAAGRCRKTRLTPHGHCCRRCHPIIVVVVVIRRRFSARRGEDDSNDKMGYTFMTMTATTTYDDKTCTIAY